MIEGYHFPPFRRDRNSKGGGKLVYLREGFIAKRIIKKKKKTENFYIEITIAKKRWCILFAQRPPNFSKTEFFEETYVTLNKALNEYSNLLLAENLNINTLRLNSDSSNHLSDLNDAFSLSNLGTDSTCFKSNKGSVIDLMLTNKPKSFYKSHSFVTGLSDCHKLIVSFLRTSFQKLPSKFLIYRNQKTSMKVISFVIWILDLFRESYTKTARIHILKYLKYFLKF